MSRLRSLNIVNAVIETVIIIFGILGFVFLVKFPLQTDKIDVSLSAHSLLYFPILNLIGCTMTAAFMLPTNIVGAIKQRNCTPRIGYIFRLTSATLSAIVIFSAFVFLNPMTPQDQLVFNLKGGLIFIHFLLPLFAVGQFLFSGFVTNAKFGDTLIPLAIMAVYGIAIMMIILVMQFSGKTGDELLKFIPFFFLCITQETSELWGATYGYTYPFWANILIVVSIYVVFICLCIFLYWINRRTHKLVMGHGYKVDQDGQLYRIEDKQLSIKDIFALPSVKTETFKSVYHIFRRHRNIKLWIVKRELQSEHPMEFPTQREAILFTIDKITKEHKGIMVVHGGIKQECLDNNAKAAPIKKPLTQKPVTTAKKTKKVNKTTKKKTTTKKKK